MEQENVEGKRISMKRKVANPLFQRWLEDLHEEAKAKRSRLEPVLQQALTSLSKYPLPLHSGADCAILKGFDRKLCKYLDQNLEVYKKCATSDKISSDSELQQVLSNSSSQYDVNVKPKFSSCDNNNSSVSQNSNKFQGTVAPPKKACSERNIVPTTEVNIATLVTVSENLIAPLVRSGTSSSSIRSNNSNKSGKTYKPGFRSGSYAILLALLEHSARYQKESSLKKDELIELAQKHSEESFTRRKPDSFYTAWSNMGNLVKKGLVKQVRSKRVQYLLTDAGKSLALELLEETKKRPTTNDMIFNGASTSGNQSGPVTELGVENTQLVGDCDVMGPDGSNIDLNTQADDVVELPAGTFDVVLLIDKHETSGTSKKNDPTVAQFNKYPDLKHEYRDLKVGDFTWVARHKDNKNTELVIPFVVERKRMDDLGASVKDGRFHEQKFRLRKCGIKNVIYLIENYGANKHVGLAMPSLMQALANTRIHDNFKVHLTSSLSDSTRFLAMMTKRLTIEYKDTNLVGCNRESVNDELMTFNYFNQSSFKNKPLKVTDTFVKLLLQVKGISVEKAVAIVQMYKTPKELIKEYQKCKTRKEGESLLVNIKYGDANRNIGQSVSKSIYQIFVWKPS